MGAIQRGGFEFDIEYSQIQKEAALHVYKNGDFIKEITFPFEGIQPGLGIVEAKVNEFLKEIEETD